MTYPLGETPRSPASTVDESTMNHANRGILPGSS
jgi:hypothetical protein